MTCPPTFTRQWKRNSVCGSTGTACINVWHKVHSSKGYLKEVVVGRETQSLWEHFAEQVRGVVVPLTPGSSWSPAALGLLHATCRSSGRVSLAGPSRGPAVLPTAPPPGRPRGPAPAAALVQWLAWQRACRRTATPPGLPTAGRHRPRAHRRVGRGRASRRLAVRLPPNSHAARPARRRSPPAARAPSGWLWPRRPPIGRARRPATGRYRERRKSCGRRGE